MEPRFTLDHVAIAVPELAPALRAFSRIFPQPAPLVEEVPSEKVRAAFLDTGGLRLEFLEPAGKNSPLEGFLASGRSGLHHLSFRVEGAGIEGWFEELRRRGIKVLGSGPRPGSGSSRVFFVHPSSAGGVLIEFSQEMEGSS